MAPLSTHPGVLLPGWQFDRPLSHAEIHEAFGTPLQPDVSARDGRVETTARPTPSDDHLGEGRGQFTEESAR